MDCDRRHRDLTRHERAARTARAKRFPPGRALLVASVLCLVPLAEADAGIPAEPGKDPGCTVVEPARRVTLVVVASHSADFCSLLAGAVGPDVFDTRVGMSPTRWHYAGAKRTCRLRLAAKPKPQITVYNSQKVCRWLMRSGWRPTAAPVPEAA